MGEDKKRILHVLGSLNRGGAETIVMNLYRELDKSKFQFDFVTHINQPGDYTDEIKKMGGRIFFVPSYKIYNHFQYKKAWKKLLDEHKEFKIIHGHVRSTAAIYLNIAKKMGRKTIAHSHSISSGSGIKALIKNVLQYRIRYIADYFMGCSKQANIWLFGKKIANSNRCYVLNNGIELNNFIFNKEIRDEYRNKLKIMNDEILIGHVGRFAPEKNHKFILNCFSKIYNINNKYKLILIGDGKEKEKIINRFSKAPFMRNVIFTGTVKNVNDYMQAMDIFILPSKFEGLGMVLIEAQISGIPCIASSNVPKEANISKKMIFCPLKCNAWIKAISNIKKQRNQPNIEEIKEIYDIKMITKKLEKFYLKIEDENESFYN